MDERRESENSHPPPFGRPSPHELLFPGRSRLNYPLLFYLSFFRAFFFGKLAVESILLTPPPRSRQLSPPSLGRYTPWSRHHHLVEADALELVCRSLTLFPPHSPSPLAFSS